MKPIHLKRRIKGAELAILDLKPGDIIVLQSPTHLTDEQARKLKDAFKPTDLLNKVIVTSGGLDIKVIRGRPIDWPDPAPDPGHRSGF